jgi:hypothetical protein
MKVVFTIKHITGEFNSCAMEMSEYEAIMLVRSASKGEKPLDFITWVNYSSRTDDWEKVYTQFSVEVLKNSIISFRIMR